MSGILYETAVGELYGRFPEVRDWCRSNSCDEPDLSLVVFDGFARFLGPLLACSGRPSPRTIEYVAFLDEVSRASDERVRHDILQEVCESLAVDAAWIRGARKWFTPAVRKILDSLFRSGNFLDLTGTWLSTWLK